MMMMTMRNNEEHRIFLRQCRSLFVVAAFIFSMIKKGRGWIKILGRLNLLKLYRPLATVHSQSVSQSTEPGEPATKG